jgi:hypothetical protein
MSETDATNVKGLGFQYALANPSVAELDLLYSHGLRAIIWLGNYNDACYWNWSDAKITTSINAIKDHPAVAYYFVADEPHAAPSGGCVNSPDDMRARVALIRSLDPRHPTLITENRREDFASLANIADVMGLIRYPCSYANGCVMSKIDETIAAANAAGIAHYWAVPQMFYEPEPGGYYRAPSATELQQIYTEWKIAPGSRIEGQLVYTWGRGCCGDDIGLADLPDLWPVVQQNILLAG